MNQVSDTVADATDATENPAEQEETFDIGIERKDGCIVYTDPILAQLGDSLAEMRAVVRDANAKIRDLEARQARRLRALNAIGPAFNYPTKNQRDSIAVFTAAVDMGLQDMAKVAYGLCLQTGAQRSTWRSKDDEPFMTYASRAFKRFDKLKTQKTLASFGASMDAAKARRKERKAAERAASKGTGTTEGA